MTAALLLIVILPFVQILIQRLRRTLEENRAFRSANFKVNDVEHLDENVPFPRTQRNPFSETQP